MKRKRALLTIAGATVFAFSVFYLLAKRQPPDPSPATLRFRQVIRGSTEVRLYKNVTETSGPNWDNAQYNLQGINPVFRLRGEQLNQFVQEMEVNKWRVNDGPQAGSAYAGAFAAEFYNGSKCLAHLRFLPGMARWYGPHNYIGEGQLTAQSWRDLQRRLTP